MREIVNGLRFPEGPIAMPDGSVILVEIARGALTRVSPDGKKTVIAETGGGPNGAAIGPDGRCYVCNNGGFEWREDQHGLRPTMPARDYAGGRIEAVDLKTGAVEVLYRESDKHKLCGPNDIVFDAHGGFYFTDLGKTRERDMDRGAVCYAKADGSFIREIAFPMLTPNGIGLSPDGSTLYVVETTTARLWAFELSGPGEIKRAPSPSYSGARLVTAMTEFCGFDSLAVDSAGNVCIATITKGGITIISPDGKSIRHVPMPDRATTNICFGGPDLRTAFITLSTSGRLVSMEWERPGAKLNYLNT